MRNFDDIPEPGLENISEAGKEGGEEGRGEKKERKGVCVCVCVFFRSRKTFSILKGSIFAT